MLESFSKGHQECIEGAKIDSVIQLKTFANGVILILSVLPGEIDTTARLCTKGLKEEMGKRIQNKQKQSDLRLGRIIPDICHFFYTVKFTPKNANFSR